MLILGGDMHSHERLLVKNVTEIGWDLIDLSKAKCKVTFNTYCNLLTIGWRLHVWRKHRHVRYTGRTRELVRRYMSEARLVVNVNHRWLIIPEIYVILQQNEENAQVTYFSILYCLKETTAVEKPISVKRAQCAMCLHDTNHRFIPRVA